MGFSFLYPGCMRLEQQYSKRSLLQLQLTPVSILKQTPKVSIVVPSYHQGQFLRATLESIFLQQYENLTVPFRVTSMGHVCGWQRSLAIRRSAKF